VATKAGLTVLKIGKIFIPVNFFKFIYGMTILTDENYIHGFISQLKVSGHQL